MSNVQIAEHVGVSKDTVAKYRTELEATCEISKSETRTGRDGRTINTANIGKPKVGPNVPTLSTGGNPATNRKAPRSGVVDAFWPFGRIRVSKLESYSKP